MGSTKSINSEGSRTSQYNSIKVIPELNMKLIEPKPKTNFHVDTTPLYSNTSKYYATMNKDNKVVQVAVYDEIYHKKIKDIDFGHKHVNKNNNKIWTEGEIHIHSYNDKRTKNARNPSKKEKRIAYLAKFYFKGEKHSNEITST